MGRKQEGKCGENEREKEGGTDRQQTTIAKCEIGESKCIHYTMMQHFFKSEIFQNKKLGRNIHK